MDSKDKKLMVIVGTMFLVLAGFVYTVTNKSETDSFSTTATVPQIEETEENGESVGKEDIWVDDEIEEPIYTEQKVPVYVCGEVHTPDVYYLDEGSIVKDAIVMAGGFTDEADRNRWNLAMEIQGGLKIEVPKVGEEIDKIANSYDNSIEGIINPNLSAAGNKLININKATESELKTLSGIGPVIAQNIINYRESNGNFRTLKDIDNVPRVGPSILSKIEDYICFQ